jgi:AMMECR1 domain-containing protein
VYRYHPRRPCQRGRRSHPQRHLGCHARPAFPPLTPDELDGLEVKVDVLGDPEAVEDPADLDPKRYGLIVQSIRQPWRRGLLLPDLEGIETVEQQVYWTRYHKAGITNPDEPVEMFRFEVKRYT